MWGEHCNSVSSRARRTAASLRGNKRKPTRELEKQRKTAPYKKKQRFGGGPLKKGKKAHAKAHPRRKNGGGVV